ncbi:MAG: branched-chain amino acid ABC transporter permease [Deltaproteobacteria bacterium]|nr:branched-chain amino acid ABC transporter permease [Deltaproteobacteria bacterium]
MNIEKSREQHVRSKENAIKYGFWLLLMFFLTLLPFLLPNPFYMRLVTELFIYGLLAMSLDVLLGYTGLLSFMHAAYMGIGAYSVGIFLTYVEIPPSLWLSFPLGVGIVLLIALPVGWLQVRTGGFAFALLTIAFGMMYYTLVWKSRDITGGDDGMIGIPKPDITIGNWSLGSTGDPLIMYYFTLFVVLICFLVTRRIIQSPFGAVLEGIRENEERASFIGYNIRRFKLLGWLLACCLAGVCGVLFTYLKGSVSPTMMDATAGGAVLMMTLLGGLGTLWGPFLGAALFIFGQDFISTLTEHWMVFMGLAVMLLVLFMPKGIGGMINQFLEKRQSTKGE